MKTYSAYLIILLLAFTISSCKHNHQINIEDQLRQAIDKYPQLKNQPNYYHLVKSLTLSNPGVQIQLLAPPEFNSDEQQIIILSNCKGVSYTIPLLNNQYKDYWQFLFDTKFTPQKLTHTTFEAEFNKAVNLLGLNKGYDGNIVLEELFNSILNCRKVYDFDRSSLQSINIVIDKSDLPVDNHDTCALRDKKSIESIIKLMHPKKYEIDNNAFWDKSNDRIYQLDFKRLRKNVKTYYHIKVYRLGCVVHPLDL